MKTVLWITSSFPPIRDAAANRNIQLLKYLSRLGWKSIILCPRPSIANDIIDIDFNGKKEILGTGEVEFYRSDESDYLNEKKSLLRKFLYLPFAFPDSFIFWCFKARKKIDEIFQRQNISLVYTTCDPFSLNFLGSHIKKRYNVPWVTDFRDLWTLNPYFKNQKKIHGKLFAKILEPRWMQKCDGFIANTPMSKEKMLKKYQILGDKSIVVRNGFDPEHLRNFKTKKIEKTIFFGGDIYPRKSGYHPENILLVIKQAFSLGIVDFTWTIHYAGKKGNEFKKMLEEIDFKMEVIDHGYLNTKEYYFLLSSMWLILLTQPKTVDTSSWVPARVYDYLGLNKNIFALVKEGELSNLLSEYENCLLCYYSENESDILESLRKFIDSKQQVKPINAHFIEDFSREAQAKKLDQFFESRIHQKELV